MKRNEPTREELIERNRFLEERLLEAEQTIKAIHMGEIDAFVIGQGGEDKIFTLQGADSGYRILVDSMNEGALILASDDTIYYCNGSFGEMIQRPIQRVTGKNFDSYIHESMNAALNEIIEESRTHCRAKGEFLLKRDDGTFLPVNLSLSRAVLNGFQAICVVVTDLSSQKQAEDEIRTHAVRLEQLNKELDEFAFVASHDLQEPLRKIQTYANMINRKYRGKLDKTVEDYIAKMGNSANRMAHLIRDLLNYSRLAKGFEPLEQIDLRTAVTEALSDLEIRIKESGAVIDVADLPCIEAESTQMRQLFYNLILNAIKFNREQKPTVKIHSDTKDDQLRIFIEDNGIGFDEQFLDRIFAPFQRLHGKNEYPGTGMGLAICRKIVERHDVSLTARSILGEGSTFIITFP